MDLQKEYNSLSEEDKIKFISLQFKRFGDDFLFKCLDKHLVSFNKKNIVEYFFECDDEEVMKVADEAIREYVEENIEIETKVKKWK